MFKTESQKNTFLEQTKAAREERALEKKKEMAIIKIQASVKGWLQRIRFRRQILQQVSNDIPDELKGPNMKPAVKIYLTVNRFLVVWKKNEDRELFEKLCRYLVMSIESDSPKLSYISVALNKEHALNWIKQIKEILYKCCEYLEILKPEVSVDLKSILLFLHTLVSFTSTNKWKILQSKSMELLIPGMNQLCANIMGHLVMRGFYLTLNSLLIRGLSRQKVVLKHVSLTAIVTLAVRPLVSASFSDKLMCMFVLHIMRVPALILHLNQLSPECITTLESYSLLEKSLEFLEAERVSSAVFDSGSQAVCLVANLVHLAHLLRASSLLNVNKLQFVEILRRLMSKGLNSGKKDSKLSRWHPLLGWMSDKSSDSSILQESMNDIKTQLYLLWTQPLIQYFLITTITEHSTQPTSPSSHPSNSHNFFKRALESKIGNKQPRFKIGTQDCPLTPVSKVFNFYHTCLTTLTPLRLDILTGLCYQDNMIFLMWKFLEGIGPMCGLKGFLDLLSSSLEPIHTIPEFNTLILFCECMTHYITLLDDIEMYEDQDQFKLSDYISVSSFLNMFLYKGVLNNLFEVKGGCGSSLYTVLHALLMSLYRRDSRRSYCPTNHWLIKDIKISAFLSDLEKGKKPTQLLLAKMPHIIPHTERVQLFRKFVANEKAVLGLTDSACASPHSTLITIHRRRIVEDGYRQLALLPPQALKGVVRVRFINEQGLDEAGIDQDGVFKEFLEETIKRVFDPGLNLFRVTCEERLYPSASSHLQDNHLHLFEFVGRMLGKAVYEGIVVDVPFASFFLSQVLGQAQEAPYSSIDELPSLDKELYKSLTFVKHYKGDSQDLALTFSVDTEIMGQLVTHELIPGGRAMPVTNQNKINYIYMMAHFRMHTQIKDQMAAFIRGFRCIINPDWLSLFSTPELQRLISGDNVPLDIADLRRHTQYYGGFHDSHRVVLWLWDILQKDFSEEEKKLFLKFVTSCSKPPLLGFAHLEPSFSIRCVEVGDDEDQGDTIGSVIRGFFTIRKRDPQNRLPTSSTCFNLLKLPNYQRKTILREKLRYAITSNTGFELS